MEYPLIRAFRKLLQFFGCMHIRVNDWSGRLDAKAYDFLQTDCVVKRIKISVINRENKRRNNVCEFHSLIHIWTIQNWRILFCMFSLRLLNVIILVLCLYIISFYFRLFVIFQRTILMHLSFMIFFVYFYKFVMVY